ncbi:MAG: hypothetical protein ACTHMP_26365 [Thermomicrobiales bacterium]
MAILTSDLYPAVRAALDLDLTADELPDSVIAMPIYAGAADSAVLARDPDALTQTGDALQHVKNAAVLFCAALLAPVVPQIVRERTPEYDYWLTKTEWTDRAPLLRGRAEEELAAYLLPAETAAYRPTLFARASATRGR